MSQESSPAVDLEPPVLDFYPEGFPPLLSPHLESVMAGALDDGLPAMSVYDLVWDERARQFRDDPAFRKRVADAVAETGLTAIDVTLFSPGADVPHGWDGVLRDVRRWQLMIDAADWLSKATTATDLRADGVNVLFGVQSTDWVEQELARVDELYDFGVRVVQLTYNDRTLVGDGCTERTDAGLSRFGVDVVRRLNDLGAVVDLSHCAEATTRDAIEESSVPPAFTHVTCRDLHDHPRGKTDEELRLLADRGGYVGVVGVPFFLGLSADLDAWMDHFDHAIEIVGAERIGVCTDWGFWTPDVPVPLRESMQRTFEELGFRGEHGFVIGEEEPPIPSYGDWQAIPAALADRGYSREEIQGFCGGNFVDYFETVEAAAE